MPDVAKGASGVVLRPMTEPEFAAYRAQAEQGYATQIADSGQMDAESAAAKATADFARLLPDGLASEGMHLWTALVEDSPVGIGWIEVRQQPGGTTAWVFDIEVDEARRGEGHGRAIMLALQEAARGLGARSMGLNVFGHNVAAIRLYESLGYTVTGQQMKVEL